MNRLLLFLVLCILFPPLLCKADEVFMTVIPNLPIPPGTLITPHLPSVQITVPDALNIQPIKQHIEADKGKSEADGHKDQSASYADTLPSREKPSKFISAISLDDATNENIFSLSRVPNNNHREYFKFVFLLNSNKIKSHKAKEPPSKRSAENSGPALKKKERTRVHLAVPGSKKLFSQQKLIKDQFLIDISIANYRDGYAREEWNVVLPSKKPRGALFCLMWFF